MTLRSYSGHVIKPVGQTKGNITVGKKYYDIIFQVVSGNVKPILGKETCERLGLLVRHELVDAMNVVDAVDAMKAACAQAPHPGETRDADCAGA